MMVTVTVAAQQHELPDLPGTELTVSWQAFKALLEALQPTPVPTPAPPAEVVLGEARYVGRIERGHLELDADLTLEVLHQGWVRAPLWPGAGVVDFDGRGSLLHRSGSNTEIVARGPGVFRITARLVLPAVDRAGANRLPIKLPPAAVNVLDIRAGDGVENLSLEGAVLTRSEPQRVVASVPSSGAVLLYSVPFEREVVPDGEAIELDPRIHVRSSELLTVGDGVLRGLLVNDYQVRVVEVSSLEVGVPSGVEVFDVTVPGLESWRLVERDGARLVRAVLGAPTAGEIRMVTVFEASYEPDDGVVVVPRFEALGIERESGFLAVAAEGAEVDLELGEGVLPADPSEIPADVRGLGGNLVVAGKYSGTPGATRIMITEHDDAPVLTAIVERLNATTIILADGAEATWIDIAVRSNRRQFLRLGMPYPELEIWSLMIDGEPARPKEDGEDILVPLPRGGEEVTASISLVMVRRGPEVKLLRTLAPRLPNLDVPVTETMWTLHLPGGRTYLPRGDGFQLMRSSASPWPVRSRSLPSFRMVRSAAPMEESMDAAGKVLSEESYAEQNRQVQRIEQQLKQRQGATRRGALPVRIALPSGLGGLPSVTVGRLLMISGDSPQVGLRVLPGWTRVVFRRLQLLLVLTAGLLLGLRLGWRASWPRWLWVGVATLVAFIPLGGITVMEVLVAVGFIGIGVAVVARIIRWRRASRVVDTETIPV